MELNNRLWFEGQTWEGTLEFQNGNAPFEVYCGHSVLLRDFDNPSPIGNTPKILIQAVNSKDAEALYEKIDVALLRRGLHCTLKILTGQKFELMIWTVGIFNGGSAWQFVLVDKDFKA